jgi:hypothetical protein
VIGSTGERIADNDNWPSALASAFASIGAFAVPVGSRDAAVVLPLEPGAYSVVLAGAHAAAGEALIEIYELPSTPTTNMHSFLRSPLIIIGAKCLLFIDYVAMSSEFSIVGSIQPATVEPFWAVDSTCIQNFQNGALCLAGSRSLLGPDSRH